MAVLIHGMLLFGDIQASEWRNLFEITNISNLAIKLIPTYNKLYQRTDEILLATWRLGKAEKVLEKGLLKS